MDFLKASVSDIDHICEIIEEGREYLRLQGVDQWQTDFPSRDKIRADIDNSYGHVLVEDGRIIGYAALITGEDPTYEEIDGEWLTDSSFYLTVHRVAISDNYRGRGYGRVMFSYFKDYALKNGIDVIRIDTHRDNSIMQKLILNSGFRYCGIITVSDGTKRNAYELSFR